MISGDLLLTSFIVVVVSVPQISDEMMLVRNSHSLFIPELEILMIQFFCKSGAFSKDIFQGVPELAGSVTIAHHTVM